jgi:VanZ family protein
MKNFLEKNKRWLGLAFWIWLLLVLIISFLPNLQAPENKTNLEFLRPDYLFHFFAYFGIASLFILWYMNPLPRKQLSYNLLFIGLGLCIGIVTELCQRWIPGRTVNIIDLTYNSAGMVIGYLSAYWFLIRLVSRQTMQDDT